MPIRTEHPEALKRWFREHGEPENTPVWVPTETEIAEALRQEAEREARRKK